MDQAFVLDIEISGRLELSRLTRCTRQMTQTLRFPVPESTLPEGGSPSQIASLETFLPTLPDNGLPEPAPESTPESTDIMRDHPDQDLLARFMRGELTSPDDRAARREIVRHLLARCPQCQKVTRRLWALGERVGSERSEKDQR